MNLSISGGLKQMFHIITSWLVNTPNHIWNWHGMFTWLQFASYTKCMKIFMQMLRKRCLHLLNGYVTINYSTYGVLLSFSVYV